MIEGRFREEFLKLPSEVLATVLAKHQRNFLVYDSSGQSLPYFLNIANRDDGDLQKIIRGN